MNTGATYRGWTYDEAISRQTDLFDARDYLRKAIDALEDAVFSYDAIEDILDDIRIEMDDMMVIMKECKDLEEKANFRLSVDV